MLGKNRDRLVWALGLSIGLNLAFAGWLAAQSWRRSRAWRHVQKDQSAFEVPAVSGKAPPAEKREGRRRGRLSRRRRGGLGWLPPAERKSLRAQHKVLKESRQQAEALLRAEEFDAPRFAGQLEQLRLKTSEIQREVHRILAKEAQSGSVEARRELAEHSWAAFSRGGRVGGVKRGRRQERRRRHRD